MPPDTRKSFALPAYTPSPFGEVSVCVRVNAESMAKTIAAQQNVRFDGNAPLDLRHHAQSASIADKTTTTPTDSRCGETFTGASVGTTPALVHAVANSFEATSS